MLSIRRLPATHPDVTVRKPCRVVDELNVGAMGRPPGPIPRAPTAAAGNPVDGAAAMPYD